MGRGPRRCALVRRSLGRELRFDGANEKFVNDAEADAMLKDTYREPFVVPDLSGAVTTSR